MKKKKTVKILLLAVSLATLTACGNSDTEEKSISSAYVTPVVENGEIAIDTDALTEHPLYINYDASGTNIQMIAVNASDGSPCLSLNTCQTCNPSPKAYFEEENGRLVCQNCGNEFTMDSVGEAAGGCNPMNINYKVEDKKLTVSVADLDSYAEAFASWSGPVE